MQETQQEKEAYLNEKVSSESKITPQDFSSMPSATSEKISVGVEKDSQDEEGLSENIVGNSDSSNKELEQKDEENAELQDALLRERAEFINFRRRIAQDRKKQINDTVASFLNELLPVFDNIDQVLAVKVEDEEVKKFVKGIEMIRGNIAKILNNKGINVISPLSEKFDPQVMEAIATEEDKEDKENQEHIVKEVYQLGYVMEDEEGERQLIRPARVRVAKTAN